MKDRIKKTILKILRFWPLDLCIVLMIIYLFSRDNITAESILNFAPESTLLAALFLILLYAVKSLSIIFPIVILNIVGGFLFPADTAIIVNLIGLLVELTVPYWIGRVSGGNFAAKLCEKHPKLDELINHQPGSKFFMTFFLRIVNCLPTDAVSMYFGANKIPFGVFILGSFLGCMPLVIAVTLLGTSITETSSPMFWVSIALTVSISVISFVIYFFWQRHKKKVNSTELGD